MKSASKPGTVSFRNSLGTALLIGMLFSLLWTVAGVAVLMDTYGKTLVEQESRRLIEQLGNKIAARIQARSLQVEALGRSLVQGARTWPHDPELYRRRIPMLLDFNDDRDIAGGGIWPEPYVFDGRNRLRSFFFGRDYQSTDAPFRFYNQYNRAPGYFEEEWYAMARFSPPGKCFWSRAYTDPHSGELMVTCSIGIHDPAGFQGAVTVDLSLAGLHAFMQSAHIDLHGDLSPGADTRGTYMFLVDRNNRFITFPDEACGSHTDSETACPVMRREHNQHGRSMPLYINAGKFARQEPAFAPIADFLERTNRDMIKRAEQSPTFDENQLRAIIANSNSLPEQEARLINAILSDSLSLSGNGRSYFADTVVDTYYRGNSSAHLYAFIIPESYWKLVVLVPESVAGAVATRLTRTILIVLAAIAFVGGGIAFYYSRRKLILPVRKLGNNV
ncbi:MAG: PDC sensor domain-containing protein, partial [Leptospiraceae bacterium]|nr:PDC sensor domain-containing protein [Leptospiraceae bacterium]